MMTLTDTGRGGGGRYELHGSSIDMSKMRAMQKVTILSEAKCRK